MGYTYIRELRRYRNDETGKFVSRSTVLAYVDEITFAADDRINSLVKQWKDGTISASDFGEKMKAEIKQAHIVQACLGKGGRSEMAKSDWGSLGRTLREQYKYMNGFVSDLDSGRYTVESGQIEVRAQMYMRAARQSFEKAYAATWGIKKLPAYPGDGQSPCVTSCRCNWSFSQVGEEVHAKGNSVSAASICDVSKTRGQVWLLKFKDGELLNPEVLKIAGVFRK